MAAPLDFSSYGPCIVKKNDQLTSITNGAAVNLTVNTTVAGYVGALCTVESGAIRTREDATAPTTTVGDLWQVGDRFVIWGSVNLQNCKIIATTATNATVDVAWLGTK